MLGSCHPRPCPPGAFDPMRPASAANQATRRALVRVLYRWVGWSIHKEKYATILNHLELYVIKDIFLRAWMKKNFSRGDFQHQRVGTDVKSRKNQF